MAHVVATARGFAEALGSLAPGELPDAALSELLVELDAEWNRIQAGRVALLGVWDARVAWAADGAQSGCRVGGGAHRAGPGCGVG